MLKGMYHPSLKNTIINTGLVIISVVAGALVFQLLDMLVRRVLLLIV